MSDAAASVRALLSDREPESRRLAAQQLGKLRGAVAAELLVRALGDEDWRVRKEAAAVAAALEGRAETIRALVAAIGDKENIGLRNAAVEALISIGPDAVPSTIEAVQGLDADGRKLAVEILGGIADLEAVRSLVHALEDPDPNVVTAAAEALGRASLAGEEARALAIEGLTRSLGSPLPLTKLAALESLSRLDAPVDWSVCEPFAADPILRRQAVAAAARSRDKAAILALAGAVADESMIVSRDALVALVENVLLDEGEDLVEVAREGLRASAAAHSRLRALARSEEARVRGAALVALGLLREVGDVQTLAEGLLDEEVSSRAEIGLRMFGQEAVGPLMTVVRRSGPPLRASAISLVPYLSPVRDSRVLDALRAALTDPSAEVVAAALKVFASSGRGADIPAVARYARHADPRVSAAACSAIHALAARSPREARAQLLGIDPRAAEAVVGCILLGAISQAVTAFPNTLEPNELRFLTIAVTNEDALTRRAAVEALSAIGGDASSDAVALAIADEDHDVRLTAIRALGEMGRAETLGLLVESAPDPETTAAALRALFDASPERAFAAARPRVRAVDPVVACAAVEVVGAVPGPRREDALFEALEHREPEVVKAALFAIGRGVDARALARLGLCLDHDSWEVRKLAAEVLGQEGSSPSRALLRARLERETDPAVRETITTGLSARPSGGEVG